MGCGSADAPVPPKEPQARRRAGARRKAVMGEGLKIRQVVLSCLFGCWAASLALAQNPAAVVDAKVVLASDGAYPNSVAKVAVVAQVASGYHINDHKPSADY